MRKTVSTKYTNSQSRMSDPLLRSDIGPGLSPSSGEMPDRYLWKGSQSEYCRMMSGLAMNARYLI